MKGWHGEALLQPELNTNIPLLCADEYKLTQYFILLT